MNEDVANNEAPVTGHRSPVTDQEDEISLFDLMIVVAKHKAMILKVTASAAIISLLVALLLPEKYVGRALILPPQQGQSAAAALLGQVTGIGSTAAAFGAKSNADMYVGLLKSRSVGDAIIERFKLKELYATDTMVETRRELQRSTDIAAGTDGLISVEFEDNSPERAAAIANGYVEELDRLTQSLSVTEAGQRRLFFDRQLKQAKKDLAEAEMELRRTQEKTGLIKLDDQGKAIIDAVATLRAQIAAKEVELEVMRAFATEKNPDYARAQQQLQAQRAQLSKLERSQIVGGDGNILVPTGKIPEAGLEYIRRLRDVKYFETIFELLAKQFELAKIDEAKDAMVIQVVDKAIVPDRKSKPRKALIVTLATLVAGFAAVVWAMLLEAYFRAANDPLQSPRLAILRRYLSFRHS